MDFFDKIKTSFTKDDLPDEHQERLSKKHASLVEQRYTESRNAKNILSQEWKEYLDAYEGNFYKKETRQKWKARTYENICNSIINSMIPLMTDRQPEIIVEPREDNDIQKAKQVNTILNYVWQKDDMQRKLSMMIKDQLMLGTGVLQITFNPDKANGMGEIETHVVDIFDLFPDPSATSPETMEYVILRTRVPKRVLKKRYPDKADQIISDNDFLESDARYTDLNDRRHGLNNVCTVLEMWDYDDDGKERVSTICNGVELETRPSPYEKEGFPFIFFYNDILNGRLWGIGEMKNLLPLQKELNKIRSIIIDNMIANQNTIWLVDRQANIKKSAMTNEHGLFIEKNAGGSAQRVPPPQLPSWIQNQAELTRKSMEEVSGIHDVSKGVSSGSVTAASAIQILTENSQTRLRGKLRNTEFALKHYGEWVIALIRQYYDTTRIVRIAGEEVHFSNKELRQPNTSRPEYLDESGQPLTDEEGNFMYELLTDFDISVKGGSSMLLNKSAQYQQMFEMFMNNAVDLESLLNAAEIGDTQKIIERMVKYKQIQDPNAPSVDPVGLLNGLGLRFNLSSTDPITIQQALNKYMQQYEEITQGNKPPEQVPNELKELQKQGLIPQNPSEVFANQETEQAPIADGIDPFLPME